MSLLSYKGARSLELMDLRWELVRRNGRRLRSAIGDGLICPLFLPFTPGLVAHVLGGACEHRTPRCRRPPFSLRPRISSAIHRVALVRNLFGLGVIGKLALIFLKVEGGRNIHQAFQLQQRKLHSRRALRILCSV